MVGGRSYFTPAVALPPSSLRPLALPKQPEPDSGLELNERDVIWASHLGSDPDPEPDSEPPTDDNPHRSCPKNAGFGLSAVLADDRGPTVRRRPTRPAVGPGPDSAIAKSAPVNVPAWHVRRRLDHVMGEPEGDDDDDGEIVPPHVIVARSHVAGFSVFEGLGRTLKGRDLRRVRNAVFQQTGFLDCC